LRLSELIRRFGLEPVAPLTDDVEIRGVRPLGAAGPGDLSFLANAKYKRAAAATRASAILVKEALASASAIQLRCDNPQLALAGVLAALYPEPEDPPGVHPMASVDPSAKIGADCRIGPHCTVAANAALGDRCHLVAGVYVGPDCVLGDDVTLFPNVALYRGVRVGSRVRIHANATIGADGFGYVQADGRHVKIPQVGGVRIEDDVEIGANAAIDRGALDDTVIGEGAKIDNLVQAAHGVKVGRHALIVSQTGISGSASIGDRVILAGQAGVVGHIHIADDAVVMGDAVVTKNIAKPGMYAGNPAEPHIQYQRRLALTRQLPELKRRIQALEQALEKERAKDE